jgi:HEAT repeat protein
MSKTLEQLRYQLSAIEPDESTYDGIGPSEIPLLERVLQDNAAWMASRAVFALSRLSDSRAVPAWSRAAADPRPEVRVAVAASLSNVKPSDANDILLKLLTDAELGVRKFAVQSVSGTHNAAVHAKLRDLETQDPAPWIREIATSKLRELRLIGP